MENRKLCSRSYDWLLNPSKSCKVKAYVSCLHWHSKARMKLRTHDGQINLRVKPIYNTGVDWSTFKALFLEIAAVSFLMQVEKLPNEQLQRKIAAKFSTTNHPQFADGCNSLLRVVRFNSRFISPKCFREWTIAIVSYKFCLLKP